MAIPVSGAGVVAITASATPSVLPSGGSGLGGWQGLGAQFGLQCFQADADLGQREDQREHQRQQADAEEDLGHFLGPPDADQQRKHRCRTEKESDGPQGLHTLGEQQARGEIFPLFAVGGRAAGFGAVAVVQAADQAGQAHEARGVAEEQQGNGREQQGRRGDIELGRHRRLLAALVGRKGRRGVWARRWAWPPALQA